jgi:SAM-dependent methyltransferase
VTAESLESIPRGNTCAGVNRAIIEHLLADQRDFRRASMLDVPCGDGALVTTLSRFFPDAEILGGDLHPPAGKAPAWFRQIDATQGFTLPGRKRDLICSVSGVMEFDNTLRFFATCRQHLADDGVLVVTNDNAVTVRDRLSYLFLGKARRFELFPEMDRPTWKFIPIQNLVRILHDAGFAVRSIRYVGAKPKDWLLLPLAALFWLPQWLHREFATRGVPQDTRRQMFPFRSLICRHYLAVCAPRPRKTSE